MDNTPNEHKSTIDGTVLQILVKNGDNVDVDSPVMILTNSTSKGQHVIRATNHIKVDKIRVELGESVTNRDTLYTYILSDNIVVNPKPPTSR
jgi:acetyl/propionyl-CoA carboxylase alpha subunit